MTAARLLALPVAAAYICTVVLANVLTERYGLVSIGIFGLVTTAGTFAAGATLLARNITQDVLGDRLWLRLVLVSVLMLIGCGLSWWLASPQLATASAVAFLVSEAADMFVYTPLRTRADRFGDTQWAGAVMAASLVGAVVDTFLFLHLAGFPLTTDTVGGQLVVKIGISWVVALTVAAVGMQKAEAVA